MLFTSIIIQRCQLSHQTSSAIACTPINSAGVGEIRSLESLPQDVLIKVLCGVEREDLKQLSQVSRTIREATSIAKKWHFAYTTPTKLRAFRTSFDSENQIGLEDIETPKAPLRTLKKHRDRLGSFVKRGTEQLETARDYQKNSRKWMYYAVLLVVVLVFVLLFPILIAPLIFPFRFYINEMGAGSGNLCQMAALKMLDS